MYYYMLLVTGPDFSAADIRAVKMPLYARSQEAVKQVVACTH
jgi:hypothetical protein